MSTRRKREKFHINVIVIGHVDSGKSTTTGHLMFKAGVVDKRTLDKYEKESREMGKESFKFAWFLDNTAAERERGVTIETTTVKIETDKSIVSVIDAPGHRDFIKNMITGASNSDYAMIVVPASQGEFETAIGPKGNTLEHCRLAYTMGVAYPIVLINKIDTVPESELQARYKEITSCLTSELKRIGYPPSSIDFIPISGLGGDNLTEVSSLTPWYKGWSITIKQINKDPVKISGKTVIDFLKNLPEPVRDMDKPLRGTAKGACKIGGIGTVAIAQVVAGFLKPGEMIYLCPANITAEAKTIEMHHENLDVAEPSDSVGINLKNIPVADLRKPNIFGHPGNNPPMPVANMTCQVLMISEIGKNNGVKEGYSPTMDIHVAHVNVTLTKIFYKLEAKTGKKIESTEENAAQFTVKCKETALILVTPNAPLCAETYSDYKGLGRFALRDQKSSIGVGFVKEIVRSAVDAKSGLMAAKGKSAPKASSAKSKK